MATSHPESNLQKFGRDLGYKSSKVQTTYWQVKKTEKVGFLDSIGRFLSGGKMEKSFSPLRNGEKTICRSLVNIWETRLLFDKVGKEQIRMESVRKFGKSCFLAN